MKKTTNKSFQAYLFLSILNSLMVASFRETCLWCETPTLPVNKGNIRLFYYLAAKLALLAAKLVGPGSGKSQRYITPIHHRCGDMCRWLFRVIYLRTEWHKQQAFYIIQLWLHSDSQRWAVDYRGGGRRSFPSSSMWICPAPIDPPSPLAQSEWRSWGRCSESLRHLRGYDFHRRFLFGHHTWIVFDKDKLT